jgi:hypothetical protein
MSKDDQGKDPSVVAGVDKEKSDIENTKSESDSAQNNSKSIGGFISLIWRTYMNIYDNNPLLWLAGTVGIIMALPIPWERLYSIGVDLFEKLRGMLGV